MEETTENKSYGYGKRPLWQWIALYVIIGLVVYGLVYYLFFAKKGGNLYNQAQPVSVSPTTATAESSPPASASSSGNIVITKADAAKGSFLTNTKGMTLYIFDKDTKGTSNCNGACASVWPPYLAVNPPTSLPATITTIKRTDGSMQFAYKGVPLYYYSKDKAPGDTTGDGVGGIWHLVKP